MESKSLATRLSLQNLPATRFTISDVAVAVDDSGSTSGEVMNHQDLAVTRPLSRDHQEPFVLWSENARLVGKDRPVVFQNFGTVPRSIFENPETAELVKQKSVFVLSTDGEISSSDVESFKSIAKAVLAVKTLVVGVIFSNAALPANLNVSVTSALMELGQNCVILASDRDRQLRIVYARGSDISASLQSQSLMPPADDITQTPWSNFPKFPNWPEFLVMTSFPQLEIPENHIVVRRTADWVDVANLNEILNQESSTILERFEELQNWDWDGIIDNCRAHAPTLAALRRFITHLELAIQQGPISDSSLDQRLVALFENSGSRPSEESRRQFHDELAQEMKQRSEVAEKIKVQTRPQRRFCQMILAQLSVQEKSDSGFLLKDYLRSNRAKRASNFDSKPDPEDLLTEEMAQDSMHLECRICFETKPGAILMLPASDDLFYTTDFAIDCPLACGYQAAEKICNFHLCFDCAKFFCHQGRDMYHRPVQGVLPIPKPQAQFQFAKWNKLLCHSFCSGLQLHNAPLLMVAAVESLNQYEWAQSEVWTEIRKNLLDYLTVHIRTSPYFDEQLKDQKVSVREAIRSLAISEFFPPKPVAMQMMVIRLLKRYYDGGFTGKELGHLFDMSLFMALAGVFKRMTSQAFENLRDVFLSETFTTSSHLIQRGTLHAVSAKSARIWAALGGDAAHLRALVDIPELQAYIRDESWTGILHVMTYSFSQDFNTALSLSALVSKFQKERLGNLGRPFADFFSLRWIAVADWPKLFSEMDVLWTRKGCYADDSLTHPTPDFFLNIGPHSCPDPTVCTCGYELLPSNRNYSSLSEAAQVVRDHRQLHFSQVYGSVHPSKVSFHVPLHSVVSQVMHNRNDEDVKENEPDDINRVGELLFQTHGARGDVYKPDLAQDLEKCMTSFREIRQSQPDYYVGVDDRIARSLAYKLACALARKNCKHAASTVLEFFQNDLPFVYGEQK